MVTLIISTVVVLVAVAQWKHWRQSRRVMRLAFGESRVAVGMLGLAAVVSILGMALAAWGITMLYSASGTPSRRAEAKAAERRLIVLLDASPSMDLNDAGLGRTQLRTARAAEVVHYLLIQCRTLPKTSLIAFFNLAKPILIDCTDSPVVYNFFPPSGHTPQRAASIFEQAKADTDTNLYEGLKAAFEIARPWPAHCASLLIVGDGETIPKERMPKMPGSIDEVAVLGVGSAEGQMIGDQLCAQEVRDLTETALRLGGRYLDVNARCDEAQLRAVLPKQTLAWAAAGPEETRSQLGLALAALGSGSVLLAAIPIGQWLVGRQFAMARHLSKEKPE